MSHYRATTKPSTTAAKRWAATSSAMASTSTVSLPAASRPPKAWCPGPVPMSATLRRPSRPKELLPARNQRSNGDRCELSAELSGGIRYGGQRSRVSDANSRIGSSGRQLLLPSSRRVLGCQLEIEEKPHADLRSALRAGTRPQQ